MTARRYTNPALKKKRKGRYGSNKRFKNEDGSWDSKGEYKRYKFLRDLEKKGTIYGLETKVYYEFELNGFKICKFKPDFRYRVNAKVIVEDYKGNVIPRDFKLRVKMLKAFYLLDCVIVREYDDMTPINNALKD